MTKNTNLKLLLHKNTFSKQNNLKTQRNKQMIEKKKKKLHGIEIGHIYL